MIPPLAGWPEGDDSRPVLIGLTGPIGCGKSTVAGFLREIGGVVIDADELAREATKPGAPTLPLIRQRFGDQVFEDEGALDRAALAGIVFSDPQALADLERIVHPAVRALVDERLATATVERVPFAVVEAIKLIEGGLADRCDEVWIVECDPATQRARLFGRGSSSDDIDRRIAAQGDDLPRRLAHQLAESVQIRMLATDDSLGATRETVENLLADALDRQVRRT